MVMTVIIAQSHLLILARVMPYSILIIPSKFKRNWFVSYLFITTFVFGFVYIVTMAVLKFQMLNVLLIIEVNEII